MALCCSLSGSVCKLTAQLHTAFNKAYLGFRLEGRSHVKQWCLFLGFKPFPSSLFSFLPFVSLRHLSLAQSLHVSLFRAYFLLGVRAHPAQYLQGPRCTTASHRIPFPEVVMDTSPAWTLSRPTLACYSSEKLLRYIFPTPNSVRSTVTFNKLQSIF